MALLPFPEKRWFFRPAFFLALGGLVFFSSAGPAPAEYAEGMEAYRKAWAAYATQDYVRAEEWGERAVRADPENAHAHALLGDLAYLRHDLTQAKSSWEKALKVNPALVAIQGQIAQVEMEMQMEGQMEPVQMGSLVVRIPKDAAPSTGSGRTGGPGSERTGGPGSERTGAVSVRAVPVSVRAETLARADPLRQAQGDRPLVSVRAELVEALAQAVAGLEPYFQYRMNRPLTVLIYPREAFYGDSPRSGTVPSLHLPTEVLGLFDGKIRIPAPSGHPEQAVHPSTELRANGASKDDSLTTVLWHEYTHAVVFDLSHGRAPRWLQEGLAQEAETIAKTAPLRHAQGERPLESVHAETLARADPLRQAQGDRPLVSVRAGSESVHAETLARADPLRQAQGDRPLESVHAETLARADPLRQAQGDRPLESVRSDSESVRAELVEARIPLRALLGISERPGEPVIMPAGQFYAASHSLVRFLLELKGWDRMRRFLADLGQGSSVETALESEYGLDLLTLEKKWREWYHSN